MPGGQARGIGLPTVEALARYDVLRLGGDTDRHRLDELDAMLATPMSRALTTAARGLQQTNSEALSAAAETFAHLDQHLLAAEATTCAAGIYRKAGLASQAALARERAAALHRQCEGAVTPLLNREQISHVLTRREREVALLAVRHTSRTIATLLGLSIATVNNALARVYTKLGISSRAQLADLLNVSRE
ncbi:helix-turn-helix transcriptional regulator [Nonomuraea sp. NPDC049784]|uniref:helix-turn-helix transcriptional regulator n=1 Tax=Nonomuraea sp. NPDC049784 TaxID=3154361 RepID=UPI0033CCD5DB